MFICGQILPVLYSTTDMTQFLSLLLSMTFSYTSHSEILIERWLSIAGVP